MFIKTLIFVKLR